MVQSCLCRWAVRLSKMPISAQGGRQAGGKINEKSGLGASTRSDPWGNSVACKRRPRSGDSHYRGYAKIWVYVLIGVYEMLIQACLIMLMLSDPNILPNEVTWLDDPYLLSTLFTEWDEVRPEPYATVTLENWLRTDRHRDCPKEIDGVVYDTWTAPYAWASDLNHDGIVDLYDFGIVAKFHRGGLKSKPPPPAPPPLTKTGNKK